MPVQSCLCLYRPERCIAVKHYWSVVYMDSMLHSDQYGAERNSVHLRHQDRGGPRNQDHRGERDEDTRST